MIGRSLPLQVDRSESVYLTFARFPGICRSVLVSLVFNRGTRMEDRPGKDTQRAAVLWREGLSQG